LGGLEKTCVHATCKIHQTAMTTQGTTNHKNNFLPGRVLRHSKLGFPDERMQNSAYSIVLLISGMRWVSRPSICPSRVCIFTRCQPAPAINHLFALWLQEKSGTSLPQQPREDIEGVSFPQSRNTQATQPIGHEGENYPFCKLDSGFARADWPFSWLVMISLVDVMQLRTA
jgi:hypothetical protein